MHLSFSLLQTNSIIDNQASKECAEQAVRISIFSIQLENIFLHKIKILGAICDNLPDFSPDVHPKCETDVKISGSSFPQISRKDNQVTISLNEVLRHLLPERLLKFGLKIKLLFSPDNTFPQILKSGTTFLWRTLRNI